MRVVEEWLVLADWFAFVVEDGPPASDCYGWSLSIMVASMENVAVAGFPDLASPRIAFTWLHALLGTCTAAAGLWLVLQMNDVLPQRLHLRGWKTLMRLTLAGYWAVALLGFATYYLFYVA